VMVRPPRLAGRRCLPRSEGPASFGAGGLALYFLRQVCGLLRDGGVVEDSFRIIREMS